MADSSEQRRKFKAMVPFFADDGSLLTAEREREALRTAVVDLDLDPDEAHGAIRQAARGSRASRATPRLCAASSRRHGAGRQGRLAADPPAAPA